MKMVIAICALFTLFAFTPRVASAQTTEVSAAPLTDTDIQLLRSDLQADKNKVIADTMQFSEAESNTMKRAGGDYQPKQRLITKRGMQWLPTRLAIESRGLQSFPISWTTIRGACTLRSNRT